MFYNHPDVIKGLGKNSASYKPPSSQRQSCCPSSPSTWEVGLEAAMVDTFFLPHQTWLNIWMNKLTSLSLRQWSCSMSTKARRVDAAKSVPPGFSLLLLLLPEEAKGWKHLSSQAYQPPCSSEPPAGPRRRRLLTSQISQLWSCFYEAKEMGSILPWLSPHGLILSSSSHTDASPGHAS